MEPRYDLKKAKNKKWMIILIILSVVVFFTAVKLYNGKNEDKKVEKNIYELWGLGKNVTESVSNDRDYDWYVDQLRTGAQSYINCGPSSIAMAAKWKNKDSTLSAQYIRKTFLDETNGTTKNVVCKVFEENNIKYKDLYDCLALLQDNYKAAFIKDLPEEKKEEAKKQYSTSYYMTKDQIQKVKQDIKEEIKAGNIVMTSMNTRSLTYALDTEKRCGKYYDFKAPHWIVIKGYKVVDNKLYFQVYDPYGGGWKYKDGTLWGMDRYYLADEVMDGYFYALSVIK